MRKFERVQPKGKYFFGAIAVLLLILALAAPALAGGWAVISLDDLPAGIAAGEPFSVGFMVRQHGVRPMEGLRPTIQATHAGTGQSFTVAARAEGEMGHYIASLEFPQGGDWDWSIEAFSMDQPMPRLAVAPAGVPTSSRNEAPGPLPMLVGIAGLAAAGTALLLALRRQVRWGFALAIAGLFVGGFGFASAAAGQPARLTPAEPAAMSQTAGERLFLAKGCATCHLHREVDLPAQAITVEVGPDLTAFTADPAYLESWLKDPAAIKPTAQMPNLGLKKTEIDALIAFLNSK
jgi:cytochrome c2